MPATSRGSSERRRPGVPQGLEACPGLGPKSAALLRVCGIRSVAALRRLGAAAAFMKVEAAGQRSSLNLLWALESAITATPWREVARSDRTRLLLELDDLRTGAKFGASRSMHRAAPSGKDHLEGEPGVDRLRPSGRVRRSR